MREPHGSHGRGIGGRDPHQGHHPGRPHSLPYSNGRQVDLDLVPGVEARRAIQKEVLRHNAPGARGAGPTCGRNRKAAAQAGPASGNTDELVDLGFTPGKRSADGGCSVLWQRCLRWRRRARTTHRSYP